RPLTPPRSLMRSKYADAPCDWGTPFDAMAPVSGNQAPTRMGSPPADESVGDADVESSSPPQAPATSASAARARAARLIHTPLACHPQDRTRRPDRTAERGRQASACSAIVQA